MTLSLDQELPIENIPIAIDVRTSDERLASAVQRLERVTSWFEESLPKEEEGR